MSAASQRRILVWRLCPRHFRRQRPRSFGSYKLFAYYYIREVLLATIERKALTIVAKLMSLDSASIVISYRLKRGRSTSRVPRARGGETQVRNSKFIACKPKKRRILDQYCTPVTQLN